MLMLGKTLIRALALVAVFAFTAVGTAEASSYCPGDGDQPPEPSTLSCPGDGDQPPEPSSMSCPGEGDEPSGPST
jgi:hypothetical protein